MLVPVPLLVPVPSGCRTFSSRGAFRDRAEANSARTQSSRKTAARLILTHTGNRSPAVRVCLFRSRYLAVTEQQHRHQRIAIASSPRYTQRSVPSAGQAGGGEAPLLPSYRLGPPVRPECWRENPIKAWVNPGTSFGVCRQRANNVKSSGRERVHSGAAGCLSPETSPPRVKAPALSGSKEARLQNKSIR